MLSCLLDLEPEGAPVVIFHANLNCFADGALGTGISGLYQRAIIHKRMLKLRPGSPIVPAPASRDESTDGLEKRDAVDEIIRISHNLLHLLIRNTSLTRPNDNTDGILGRSKGLEKRDWVSDILEVIDMLQSLIGPLFTALAGRYTIASLEKRDLKEKPDQHPQRLS